MNRLILKWNRKSDNLRQINLPEGFCFRCSEGSDKDIEYWLDIVQHGLTDGRSDKKFFMDKMAAHPDYMPESVFFVVNNGIPCATISVFCNNENLHGHVHMVAAMPDIRGIGIGKALANYAVNVLIKSGMNDAHLNTDDFRIPAIKAYLQAGFEPELEGSEDYPARWEAIMKVI